MPGSLDSPAAKRRCLENDDLERVKSEEPKLVVAQCADFLDAGNYLQGSATQASYLLTWSDPVTEPDQGASESDANKIRPKSMTREEFAEKIREVFQQPVARFETVALEHICVFQEFHSAKTAGAGPGERCLHYHAVITSGSVRFRYKARAKLFRDAGIYLQFSNRVRRYAFAHNPF